MAWTEEQVATMQKMLRDGANYREIADAIGVSPCAVSGKVWRLSMTPQQAQADRDRKRIAYQEKRKRGREISQDHLVAAAIVADGGSYRDAMRETGLSYNQVQCAVALSRTRENHECSSENEHYATAWGTLGRPRDARA